jgi:lipid-binding SYLF domain-containing protein
MKPSTIKVAAFSLAIFLGMMSPSAAAVNPKVAVAAKNRLQGPAPGQPRPQSGGLALEEAGRVSAAAEVLRHISAIPEKSIPPALLRNAHGIVIIPGIVKAAFFLGGRYGSGVLLINDRQGGWSNPVFVKVYGGGFGWQVGVQSTDVIIVFKSDKSITGITRGKFTLGVDASVAAGPVGRSVQAATDLQLKAEIYSYSRTRGFFAGVSLEGAAIQIDHDANADFYGKDGIKASDIFSDRNAYSAPSQRLRNLLDAYGSNQTKDAQ